MRLTIKRMKMFVMTVAVLLGITVPAINVQAATGKTTIAVSSDEIDVGDTVTVTVKAKTESGGSAKAKMKLTYDEDILEFVSCSATYDGGAGGSVTATASSMTVKFKAVAEGKCPVYVDASNGVDASSGNSLSSIEDSSTNIKVTSASNGGSTRLSADNSLKSLTLSAGTLSPDFAGNVVNYTATVANEITAIEVNAVTSNANATIESVAGNTDLQIGLNKIKIVVKAENGALVTYTIEVTRQEAVETPSESETVNSETVDEPIEIEVPEQVDTQMSQTVENTGVDTAQYQKLENSYNQLEELYQREKVFSRGVIYVLIFVIAVLLVAMINIILHYRRKLEDDFEDDFEDIEPTPKKKETPKTAPKKVEAKAETAKQEKAVTKVEETSPKVEKTSPKVEVRRNNIEVFDFNDED